MFTLFYQTTLGHISKREHIISCDAVTGAPLAVADGGVKQPKSDQTSVKFPQEARGCFGAGMVKNSEGVLIGVKCNPFNYTGRTVLGKKKYEREISLELNRVIGLKGIWSRYSNGYKDKYPDTWREEVKRVVDKNYCNICDIMDHVVSESKNMYFGTDVYDTFVIYHDGLSQWWESESQAYLENVHHFKNRQVKCYGNTNI